MVIFMMMSVTSGYNTKVGTYMPTEPDEADSDELELPLDLHFYLSIYIFSASTTFLSALSPRLGPNSVAPHARSLLARRLVLRIRQKGDRDFLVLRALGSYGPVGNFACTSQTCNCQLATCDCSP
jgi:hypothetical protein